MSDKFQTQNGDLSQKQSGYLKSSNGDLNSAQQGNLATADKNGALSEKLAKDAPKSGNNSVIKSVVK